jgi:FlaA1/EpsC-like NDP-sugar epimerase
MTVFFKHRRLIVLAVHLAIWTATFLGAFALRFEFTLPEEYYPTFLGAVPALLVVRALMFHHAGGFRGMWRYTGARDLTALVKATTASTAVFAGIIYLATTIESGAIGFPRSVFIIEWVLCIMAVGGLRFGIRTFYELAAEAMGPQPRRKILIVGAGNAAETLVRDILRSHASRYDVVGFVDDDATKMGVSIHGISVLGSIASVPDLLREREVDEVIVAIPSATGRQMRRIMELCDGAAIRTIPETAGLIEGRVTVNALRKVAIEDLLGREAVVLDTEAISEFVRGKVVLVTGAGGSIGSELCRQVGKYEPSALVLVERTENNLFHVHRELTEEFPEAKISPCLADVCDELRMREVFSRHRPAVVFHAAAHKHVPMMEWNPGEAVKNNIVGTRRTADLAHEHGVEQFVLISTDKAVKPRSVMGATKRVSELYVQALSVHSRTRFITVRFGNVLGSAGSVIPIFQQQIAKGGPVTVTHPDMTRYFMTIPEACQLVLEAATIGKNGEILILDMGEPVKIVDVARDLIRLSGLEPEEDIEIVFTGVRPGEKLFEELSTSDENVDRTRHPKILVGAAAKGRRDARVQPLAALASAIDQLEKATASATDAEVRSELFELIPGSDRSPRSARPSARALAATEPAAFPDGALPLPEVANSEPLKATASG